MNRHQVLTGAANAGDHCYSVGSVEGVPFTAYASGCNIVILASDFQRVQIIPGIAHGNVQVGCLDCSTDVGKIAAAYGKEVCIFEPTPLFNQESAHKLDYQWVQTAAIATNYHVQVLSWNLAGSRLLSGGTCIQLWQLCLPIMEETAIEEEPTTIQVTLEDGSVIDKNEQYKWDCIWRCKTAQPVTYLKFSPDGTLFASAGSSDRLVKIWYSNKVVCFSSQSTTPNIKFTFIYIAHPRAITGLSWRKTSKFMPRDSVANMLVTSCRDNICRVWVQTLVPEDGSMNQYKRRQATQFVEDPNEVVPTLPSTYSVHDFHSFGLQGSGITPGLHFHLAASINAETDIPLVPRLNGGCSTKEPNFVVHWLNNKEMEFTHAAEHLLQDVSTKVLHTEKDNISDFVDVEGPDNVHDIKIVNGPKRQKITIQSDSQENLEAERLSKRSSSNASSSTSIATDTSASQTQNHSGDYLDRKIEVLLRDWHRSPDLLFSVYPADGSFLVWLVDWLDEYNPGSFRQAQISFASRIPNAIPLGDACTMSHYLYLYSPHAGLDLRMALSPSFPDLHREKASKPNADDAESTDSYSRRKSHTCTCAHNSSTPIICMLSKHHNGSLNLWHMTFGEKTNHTQVLSIGHTTRVCGHRFRINDVSCHPVLPLLLTTSHHNLPSRTGSQSPSPSVPNSPCCPDSSSVVGLQGGFCSELILWKVEPVGPLSKSGGITELARINSLETAAFANVAWIPTLLPSTTQGSISNSPSACFVASDGHQLRIYQAVIDARTLLAEMTLSSRRKSMQDLSQSSSSSSGLGYRPGCLHEAFKIVSEQSTSRPGCVIELDSICDATHFWQNTMLLHVFQEQLITSSPPIKRYNEEGKNMGLVQPDLQAIVDLRHSPVFEEPFYLVVLEKQDDKSVMHMWRIVIASQIATEEHDPNFAYAPDSNIVQEDEHSNRSSRSQTPDPSHEHGNHLPQVCPLRVTTTKVYTQTLPLPTDVEIVHATPAAGHLSSSNIYPACYAPYLICTACSDSTIRFWKCEFIGSLNKLEEPPGQYNWVEWEMMLNNKCSSIQIPGKPLYVSCAYSGRMACAYKFGRSFTKHDPEQSGRYINMSISIFECESTGGSEWILEDTINLKNIGLPEANLSANLNLNTLYDASQKNRRTAEVLIKKITTEDLPNNHCPPLQRLLSVPSYTTLQTLRLAIIEQGNQCVLTQKSLVQLDWASAEDGSHILTVAISSKILLFTPVSNDIAQANVQAMKASKSASRPLLKQASSMVLPLSCNDEIRWMRIRTTYLKTADSLPPLPMHCSWVRHGILVVGMDNEMHIYSQWRAPSSAKEETTTEKEKDDNIPDGRKLTEEELLSKAQEISQLRLPGPSGTLSRSTSSTILNIAAETQKKKKPETSASTKAQSSRDSLSSLGPMPDFGLFEACRLACPVLPQYHPKQLMELLGFGKLRRVKAILGHLVRCLSETDCVKKTYLQVRESMGANDAESEGSTGRSWSRTRAMSLAAGSSPLQPSPMDPQGSLSLFPEEVTLDYVEIQSISPLPLFTLLAADKEKTNQATVSQNLENVQSDQDYTGLFDTTYETEENLDEILHDKIQLGGNKRERPSISGGGNEQKLALTYFGPRQATLLTKFLTHSHLPGLSSLDQMHLLALADTVASFNTALADRFGAEIAMPKEPAKGHMDGLNVQITTDSLDDCGLRFLLAMQHYTYLLRCLPLVQRAQLQNQGLGSHSLVWAFHSETQEELLQLVPCIQRGNPKWSELKELGAGWWVRSNTVLRRLMEKVAKAAFQINNNPLDAALFYLAMKKKTLVWGLFRSIQETRMTDFFRNNFSEDKWRKAALKNAFALMGKQRFEHATAFFLLAGSLDDAVDVCLNKLDDPQLAMVIVRLYEGEIETVTPALRKILFEGVLGCEKDGSNYIPSHAHPDPFLRCMARWILQDYCGSLTTLLQTDVGYSHPKATEAEMNATDRTSANPSVFNFYLFLRMHPLVVRRQKQKNRPSQFSKDAKDNSEVPYEDAISPLERRLFFTTSHAHFRAGCPALALEVLSRLPCHVVSDGPMSPDDAVFDFANVLNSEDKSIVTGTFSGTDETKTVDSAAAFASTVEITTTDFDWGAPVSIPAIEEPLELKFDDSDSGSENGLAMKTENIQNDTVASDEKSATQLDIMAQQLKFIACLKIMMEELSTLATGFEADGGQLRYQLYVWLERSVAALKDLCNYGCTGSGDSSCTTVTDDTGMGSNEPFSPRTSSHIDDSAEFQHESRPSLHEILLADKLDFETKLQRAGRRKEWLKANEALLRTLLSYCSLHGALGGGLAAVRIELIFLLHELQQERSHQQLLSPLPFPTTLPLLTASVACQKTVVADPIRHLQALAHDILLTIIDMTEPPAVSGSTFSCVVILRDLSTSLSACLYESLCDSDTFVVKQGGGQGLSMEMLLSSGVVYQNSHLLAGHMRHRQFRNKEQTCKVTTSPNKWPGVPSLRALLAQDKDEDSPKLHTLLCEAFVAVYLSQLIHAVATCDCHVLYRLVGQQFTKESWAALFGGGAKMLLHISNAIQSGTPPVTPACSLEKDNTLESGTSIFDTFSRQRIMLHMKFLGQQGQSSTQPEIKEGKPTFREQFIPPQMSMVSLLMTKAQLPPEWVPLDYDSNESLPSDDDVEDEPDIDDVFGESQESSSHPTSVRKKIISDSGGLDQLDPLSYTWGILRYAIVKLAHHQLFQFLNVAGIEVSELPVTSPLLHAGLKSLEAWLKHLKLYMDSFDGPPANYIPGCYVENTTSGPAILKYKALLELHNTPFRSNRRITMPVKRLWNFLVRQEIVQEIFIRYIFKRKPLHFQEVDHCHEVGTTPEAAISEPIRILHKNQDTISTFCISNVTKGFVAVATPKEMQELNVSVLLEPIPWLENEAEYDVINLLKPAETLPSSDYLVVQHPLDKVGGHSGPSSTYNSPTGTAPPPLSGQSARSAAVLSRHKIDGVRKLAAHPLMPVYLSGSQDGSVHLWEWSHPQRLSSPRPSGTFAKVTRILFNLQGNKFGVTDGDGNISLWQAGLSSISNKPFFSAQCHNKNASDFAFVGSSSLIATSGYSSDNKNVCIWDALLPQGKCLVEAFTCHDHGSSAMVYATQNQALITAGKKGDVCIFDVRQRQLRHKFTAHDSAIKCIALDPGEEFFATGSVDGDIKVWGLNVHVKLYSFTGEHTKSTLFRNVSNGVSQLEIDEDGRLFSCGADGSLKMRTLPDRDLIVNAIVQ